jgi:hypothetical protein
MREQINDLDEKSDDGNNANELAQKLWIKANTRPCPKVGLLFLTYRSTFCLAVTTLKQYYPFFIIHSATFQ